MFQKLAWLNYSFWAAIDDALLKAFKDYSQGVERLTKGYKNEA